MTFICKFITPCPFDMHVKNVILQSCIIHALNPQIEWEMSAELTSFMAWIAECFTKCQLSIGSSQPYPIPNKENKTQPLCLAYNRSVLNHVNGIISLQTPSMGESNTPNRTSAAESIKSKHIISERTRSKDFVDSTDLNTHSSSSASNYHVKLIYHSTLIYKGVDLFY